MSKNAQAGNALFLILVVVVLFAALSYAVTSASRSGGGNADKEENQILAAEIVNYTSSIRVAVMRMIVGGECNDTDISFYMPAYPETNGFEHTPAQPDICRVFNPAGGAIPYRQDLFRKLSSFEPFIHVSPNHEVKYVGSDKGDLILYAFVDDEGLCKAINEKLSIENPGGSPPVDNFIDMDFFTGTYLTDASDSADDVIGDSSVELEGEHNACFYASAGSDISYTPRYVFYHVLAGR